jgi:hypothetical protein
MGPWVAVPFELRFLEDFFFLVMVKGRKREVTNISEKEPF